MAEENLQNTTTLSGDLTLTQRISEGFTKIQKPVFWFAVGYVTHVIIKMRQKKFIKV